ncbi:CapA family protein [Sulfuriferula multivorans]|uniref:CapA family protein n=1 Tax=Sulfuriferula multivorans TaxID=1559896 RepID=UPI0021D5386D|nr:CapA family protein [Sulfuriferula multivorans]
MYREKPVLYGCGDFLNDYEGISGHEQYRGELALMYFPTLEATRLIGILTDGDAEPGGATVRHAGGQAGGAGFVA